MLLGKTSKIGYFKPIININPEEGRDAYIETIISHFNLPVNYDETFAFSQQEVLRIIEAGNQGDVIDTIINKYKRFEEDYDYTVVEGSDFLGGGTAFELDANVTIAKNLGAPVVIVVSGEGKTTSQIINTALSIKRNFKAREVQVLAIVANKVKSEQVEDIRELLQQQLGNNTILAVIPDDQTLKSPSMKEVGRHAGTQVY